MERTVNVALIQKWIDENSLAALSDKSGLSVYYLMKVKSKSNPLLPRKDSSQLKLAAAIGASRDELFPLKGKRRAS